MSDKKNMLGMNMLEWKSLAGLQDPYSLELAKLSAEVGVPNVVQFDELTEARRKPVTPAEKRLAIMKHLHRSRRKGAEPDQAKVQAYEKGMKGVMAKAANEGVTRDEVWEALLFDHGLTLSQFDGLLDEALDSGDDELAGELLALEDRLDEIAGALGAVGKGLAKAGGVAKDLAIKGGKGLVKGAKMAKDAAVSGAKKGYDLARGAGDAAGKGMDLAKAGADAAGAAKPGAAAPGAPPAGNGGAAKPAAAPNAAVPATAPDSAAPATPGESPAAQKAPAPGAGTGQPGQPGAKKQPGLLKNVANLAKGVAKVGVGSAGITTGVASAPVKGAVQVVKGAKAVKKGAAPAAESFGEWLEQRGVTLRQYEALIDYAMENNDVEEMDSLLALEDLYNEGIRDMLGMRPKKTKVASPEMWKRARDVVAKHGPEATKKASQSGRQVGQGDKKKSSWRQGGGTSVNSAVEHYYHLVGRPITEG